MRISIIIPVYNVENYVARCLYSVIRQTYTGELECIIVDDATPDGSMYTVNRILAGYTGPIHFKCLHHTVNQGLSAARNTGIRQATGEYVFFLDSDDEISDDCIRLLANLVLKYPEVDMVQGNIRVEHERYRFWKHSENMLPPYSNDASLLQKYMLRSVIPVTAWNKLIRKTFITENKLWFKEGIIHEDEYWRIQASQYIQSVAFCMDKTYFYHYNPKGIMHSSDLLNKSVFSWLVIFDEWINSSDLEIDDYKKIIFILIDHKNKIRMLSNPTSYLHTRILFLKKQICKRTSPFPIKIAFLCLLLSSYFINLLVILKITKQCTQKSN